jgi:uncharacterized membrane protein YgcG
LTALSVGLGAPVWFDLIQQITGARNARSRSSAWTNMVSGGGGDSGAERSTKP